jgi:O-antigen ligase
MLSTMSAKRLESLCLFTLFSVIALRPLISETYDSSGIGFGPLTAEVSEPSPARTAALDLFILMTAAGLTLARLRQRESYRWTGLELGTLVIAAAAIISSAYAGNKRIAINAATDWVCLPILTMLLVQLLKRPSQIRLLLCITLASAAVQAYSCFEQVFISFPETRAEYEKSKVEFWAGQGIDLDSPQARLFEARLNSAEATGYLTHSNVTGGCLALTAFTAAAWAWQRKQSKTPRPFIIIPSILAGALISAAILTKSKGAIIAAAAGILLVLIRWKLAPWINLHPVRARRLGWGFVAGGIAALIGHGLYHGSLPGDSLNFRWQYWTASAQMVADHPITGVGSENFGRKYLQYKSVEAVEDVARPHNFLVAAASEWGIPGLVGIVLLAVGATAAATRHRPNRPPASVTIDDLPEKDSSIIGWSVGITATVFAVRLLLLNSTNSAYLLIETAAPAFIFLVTFILIGVESKEQVSLTAKPIATIAVGINIALFVFLLQDGINFALHIPGAATTFFALLAVPIALRSPATESSAPIHAAPFHAAPFHAATAQRAFRAKLILAALSAAILAHSLLTVEPTQVVAKAKRAADSIVNGRDRLQRQPPPIDELIANAKKKDPFDPTPWELDWQFQSSSPVAAGVTPEKCLSLINAAIARDPYATRLWRIKMNWHAFQGRVDFEDRAPAIEAARMLTRLHPTAPESWIALGDRLAEAVNDPIHPSSDSATPAEAIAAYQRAIDLDNAKPKWEQFRRLTTAQRQAIKSKISNLKSQISKLESES